MRTGDWIATFSGGCFYVTDPHLDDVDIKDVAHGLSLICRFGGQTREFYSVAQHCVLCSWLVKDWGHDLLLRLHAILHDASEAYIGDIVRPLKHSMPDYIDLEDRTMGVIYQGLELPSPSAYDCQVVKKSDNVLVMTERRDLINHRDRPWTADIRDIQPLRQKIEPWSPAAAEMAFLAEYDYLRAKLRAGVAST